MGEVILENFRGYSRQTRIEISDLTALIGTNDIRRSTILEALEIFFNSKLVKFEASDVCAYATDKTVTIGCVFCDIPQNTILDSSAQTTLEKEYLLNQHGCLEIGKIYDCCSSRVREGIFAYALHPSVPVFVIYCR